MWRFVTEKGTFHIRWTPELRYEVLFGGRRLGSYPSPAAAANALAAGHTFSPSLGMSGLDIPSSISHWEFVPRGRAPHGQT